MTATARIPNRNRDGWITIEYREGTLDKDILDEVWLGDSYHLEGIADVIGPNEANHQRGGVVIDVGANIGAVTLRCLDLGARQVIAIEPEDDNRALWSVNCADDRAVVCAGAVGDPAVAASVDTVGTSGAAYTQPGGAVTVLDFAAVFARAEGYLAEDERVALLKVDVEGAEYPWFQTATREQLARIDRIHGEFHGLDNHGVNDGDYGRLMTTLAATHSVSAFGDPATGGMWYAHRS